MVRWFAAADRISLAEAAHPPDATIKQRIFADR
jgi:hypothetical protein